MKSTFRLGIVLLAVCGVALYGAGCGPKEAAPAASASAPKSEAPADAGTAAETAEAPDTPAVAEEHDDHDEHHVHEPMYGGKLVELGDHVANIEVVFDSDTGTATLYTLDAHAENPVRLSVTEIACTIRPGGKEPYAVTLRAVADPLTGETVGDTSKFEGSDERLKGVDAFQMIIPSIDFKGMVFQDIRFAYGR